LANLLELNCPTFKYQIPIQILSLVSATENPSPGTYDSISTGTSVIGTNPKVSYNINQQLGFSEHTASNSYPKLMNINSLF